MIALPDFGGAVQDANGADGRSKAGPSPALGVLRTQILVGSAPWMKIVYTNNHLQLFPDWCISIIVILEECANAAHDLLKTQP